jgi:predicted dehydrogenase
MKVAVIGCGYWGPNLIRNFVQSNKVKELICCDLDPKRLDRMKNLYPSVQVLSDYQELVRCPDLDAVVIATPVKPIIRWLKIFFSTESMCSSKNR